MVVFYLLIPAHLVYALDLILLLLVQEYSLVKTNLKDVRNEISHSDCS